MSYSLYDRIYDTLKYNRFYSYGKEVFIDDETKKYLVNKLMKEIKNSFDEVLQ